MTQMTGSAPFQFKLRDDLHHLPASAYQQEVNLHTRFATAADNSVYYGLQGMGIIRISADMQQQNIIPVAVPYREMNFHSVRIASLDNQECLILTANDHQQVIIMTLAGEVLFTLHRPTLASYQQADTPYKPTDSLVVDNKIYIADGYGSQYIAIADIHTQKWLTVFGGQTEDRYENGRFRTAHGLALTPDESKLIVVDRWNSRLQIHNFDGDFVESHHLPYNAWLCNIDVIQWEERSIGVIACLYDVDEAKQRPAPIYIIDMQSYNILSTLRPKEHLGVEQAQRMHNAVWHVANGKLYIICHSWNPGKFIILEHII